MTREEAIKIVRNIYQTDAEKEALATLIPELAENEDERIIRTLQDYVKNRNWPLNGATQDEVLAYLERQKEQKPKAKAKSPLSPHELYDAKIEGISQGRQDVLDHPEQFGLQKPAEKLSKKEYVKKFKALCDAYEIKLPNREYDIYGLCEDLHKLFGDIQNPAEWSEDTIRKAIEEVGLTQHQINWFKNNVFPPKQEWSEEDKVMLNNIIWSVHMKSIIKPLYEMDDRSRYKKYEDFLKALPERFNLQPRTEWSEEDEQTFIKSVETLEYLGKFELANWLKEHKNQFLKPQNTWKPSEEEIGALAEAMDRNDKIGYLLHQLHEELKHNYKL